METPKIADSLFQVLVFKDVDKFFFGNLSKPIFYGLILSFLYFICLLICSAKSGWKSTSYLLLSSVGFSLPLVVLAFVAGYMAGISKSSVVGTIVPAVLTFVGALNVYAVAVAGDEKIQSNKIAISYSVFLFSTLFFYGVQTGAYKREYENERRIIELSRQESRIRQERRLLDLPPDPPVWIWSLD